MSSAPIPRAVPDDLTPIEDAAGLQVQIARMLANQAHRDEVRHQEEIAAKKAEAEAAAEESARVEARERSRDKRANRIVGIVGTIVGVFAPAITGGAVYLTNESMSSDIAVRFERNEGRIQRLGEGAVEQEIQLVESVRYLSDKIDRSHPEAVSVEKPDAVIAGEKRVDEIKRSKRVEEMLAEPIDADNPLRDSSP